MTIASDMQIEELQQANTAVLQELETVRKVHKEQSLELIENQKAQTDTYTVLKKLKRALHDKTNKVEYLEKQMLEIQDTQKEDQELIEFK